MEHSPELCPVVETPWFEGEPPWPWPAARREPFKHMALSGDMSDEDVGLAFGLLVSYNDIKGDQTDILERNLVNAEALILPGGLRVRSGGREIAPACCCGLEDWREWERFLDSGVSPWLGHDPFAWAELADDIVRVWSDGGSEPAPDAYAIEFERSHFEIELRRVEKELYAFASRAEHWARGAGFSAPDAVRSAVERHFCRRKMSVAQ